MELKGLAASFSDSRVVWFRWPLEAVWEGHDQQTNRDACGFTRPTIRTMSKMDQRGLTSESAEEGLNPKRIIALHLILVVHPQTALEVLIMTLNHFLDGAENREGRGHGISCGGVRCHHGHQRSRRQPHARAGVRCGNSAHRFTNWNKSPEVAKAMSCSGRDCFVYILILNQRSQTTAKVREASSPRTPSPPRKQGMLTHPLEHFNSHPKHTLAILQDPPHSRLRQADGMSLRHTEGVAIPQPGPEPTLQHQHGLLTATFLHKAVNGPWSGQRHHQKGSKTLGADHKVPKTGLTATHRPRPEPCLNKLSLCGLQLLKA